jgi:ribosomal protein L11 methyltransferase
LHAPALEIRFRTTRVDERELVSGALVDVEIAAIHEIDDGHWRVFFRSPDERDRAARMLSELCDVEPIDIEDDDWARRSQQALKAVQIGNIIVAPPWDLPAESDDAEGGAVLIVIEPSTGFGTGHHATTRLCLKALQQIDLHGTRVIDVGTGSGVLAIAAAKLGATRVVGLDNDPDAIAAARDNARRNDVEVELRQVDLAQGDVPDADVVLANLTGAALQQNAAKLASLTRGGTLIVSGALDEEEPDVMAAFAPWTAHVGRDHESGWCCLTFAVL